MVRTSETFRGDSHTRGVTTPVYLLVSSTPHQGPVSRVGGHPAPDPTPTWRETFIHKLATTTRGVPGMDDTLITLPGPENEPSSSAHERTKNFKPSFLFTPTRVNFLFKVGSVASRCTVSSGCRQRVNDRSQGSLLTGGRCECRRDLPPKPVHTPLVTGKSLSDVVCEVTSTK